VPARDRRPGPAGDPLAQIRFQLARNPDSWTRNNAAFALLAIAGAGNHSEELAEACRAACMDPDPGVRAQSASALGLVQDPQSVPVLITLLSDEANLVALASAAALSGIGRTQLTEKGRIARALADSLDEVRPDRRGHFMGALIVLSGKNLGEDAAAWKEWAYRLP